MSELQACLAVASMFGEWATRGFRATRHAPLRLGTSYGKILNFKIAFALARALIFGSSGPNFGISAPICGIFIDTWGINDTMSNSLSLFAFSPPGSRTYDVSEWRVGGILTQH